MNKVDTYKKNQKLAKGLKIASPFVFWLCIVLCIICFCFACKNSIGNIVEISDLLDGKLYNDTEIAEHYATLIDKYGEMVVGSGASGFQVKFINVKNAVFNAFMLVNGIASVVFLISAFLLGKWLLPMLSEKIIQENQDMVNLTILEKEKD